MIGLSQGSETFRRLPDEEFFARLDWHSSAPRALRQAAQSADWQRVVSLLLQAAGGRLDAISLRGRKNPQRNVRPIEQAVEDRQSLWSRNDLVELPRATDLVRAWARFGASRNNGARAHHDACDLGPFVSKKSEGVDATWRIPSSRNRRQGLRAGRKSSWRARWEGSAELVDCLARWSTSCGAGPELSPLEVLVLFEVLRDAGMGLPIQLARRLLRMAISAALCLVDRPGEHGFMQAELRWQAGLLFSALAAGPQLAASGREAIIETLLKGTDARGIPLAERMDDLTGWLTTLVRARSWGRRFGRPLFDRRSESRFRSLTLAVSRMCRADGRPAFSNGAPLQLEGVWSVVMAPPLGPIQIRPRSTGESRQRLKKLVFQSDRSRLACLRSHWAAESNSLFIRHHERVPGMELVARGKVLFSGPWEIDVTVDGRALSPLGAWTCVCWYCDEEADYLELSARFSADVRVERQMLLSRKDDLLILADAVMGGGESKIEYASRLPALCHGTSASKSGTRECRLAGRACGARVIPLGLPCEKMMGSAGRLECQGDCIELRQSGVGGLYAPLMIDWNPARSRFAASWRSLTVAQDGKVLPPGLAAGFRLQIGRENWLIYRSLSFVREPRSVLGQHTMYETLIGRFLPSGDVQSIVSVEQPSQTPESGGGTLRRGENGEK